MWRLERGGELLADSEDDRYYLIVNGERARSRRTKELYGHVISIHRSEEKNEIKFIFADDRGANVNVDEMTPTDEFPTKEVAAIVKGFAASTQAVTTIPETQFDNQSDDSNESVPYASTDDDTQFDNTPPDNTPPDNTPPDIHVPPPDNTHPLMTSTPLPQKRTRSTTGTRNQAEKRKRARHDSGDSDKENSFSVEAKCKGRYKVSVSQLLKAPEGMLAKKVSDDSIGPIKTVLRDNRPQQLPIIPVMATGPWTGGVALQDKFIVLAGYSLFMAAKDLSTDVKFADYRQLNVHIFCDVGGDEIHQVEALFGLQASLLKDGGESLEGRVSSFREMLYSICGTDRQVEPPKPRLKVSAQWRRMCAASIGRSTERCAMKALEPTFQIAQYSNRCYEKVSRIFQIEQEKGKEVKQSIFLPLQGLGEGERFTVLSSAVSGDIALKDIKAVATTKKLLQDMKNEMIHQLGASSWEEVQEVYPLHSAEDVLKPYRGLDFKKSLPRTFLKLIESAKYWKTNKSRLDRDDKLHIVRRVLEIHPPSCRMELAFINVRTGSDITEAEGILQSRTTLVYMCDDVMLAGRTVEQLEGKQHTYSVLLNKEDNKVQHLVVTVWRPDGIVEKPPQLDTVLTLSKGFYRTLVERFSSMDDMILVYGPITDAVVAAISQGRRAIAVTECREVEEQMRMMVAQQSAFPDNSDPYVYDDN